MRLATISEHDGLIIRGQPFEQGPHRRVGRQLRALHHVAVAQRGDTALQRNELVRIMEGPCQRQRRHRPQRIHCHLHRAHARNERLQSPRGERARIPRVGPILNGRACANANIERSIRRPSVKREDLLGGGVHLHTTVAVVCPQRRVGVVEHPVQPLHVAVRPKLERTGDTVLLGGRAKRVLGRGVGAVAHDHVRHGQLRLLHGAHRHAHESGVAHERGWQLEGDPHPVVIQLELVCTTPLVGATSRQRRVLG
mmetsp:Transcript_10304/g.32652  ORF Transcript_10304/g.32652 Transcript_10304/m.32652 type:complete len:253 (-) Transcript_10304:1086-1844(-)